MVGMSYTFHINFLVAILNILIDVNTHDVNLRTLYDSIFELSCTYKNHVESEVHRK